jgi:hypothetical protein
MPGMLRTTSASSLPSSSSSCQASSRAMRPLVSWISASISEASRPLAPEAGSSWRWAAPTTCPASSSNRGARPDP